MGFAWHHEPDCCCGRCTADVSSCELLGELLKKARYGMPLQHRRGPTHALAPLLAWGAKRWCSSQAEYVRASVLLARADRVLKADSSMVAFWRASVATRDRFPHEHRDLIEAARIRAAVRVFQPWSR